VNSLGFELTGLTETLKRLHLLKNGSNKLNWFIAGPFSLVEEPVLHTKTI
jgi:hypothetical protein